MTDDDAVPGLPDAVPGPADLRASDADRERVSEVLRDALAEGRLDMVEFEERLDQTYKARTYGELAPITRDLPAAGAVPPSPVVSLRKEPVEEGSWAGRIVGGEGSSTWAVAVLSGFQRKGRWTVPRRFNCFAFCGGGEIDLREADFTAGEVVINCVAIMGGVQITVPPGVEVDVRGIGVMGGFDQGDTGVREDPDAPRVVVTGFAFWGGVGVERKKTRAARRQEKLDRKAAMREARSNFRDEIHGAHQRMLDSHKDLLRGIGHGHGHGHGHGNEVREERPERRYE
ncbi:Cell wall-active antibiotics response 4TMS YvqF [Streptomyces sp. yr375]|uniref:DUF1707 SHOCT-like domain-containing protein n=1 Tax=Streptomyces sp. yr375 TaxID=1761906 RepID=UPI0008D3C3D3|nr:DUF1707 domain-containing protein [Streptomyces sp. yr375]SEQ31432.1 Cell wall-active antibiotics response 4TMS YvqF [Streptomyces sp. yr375]